MSTSSSTAAYASLSTAANSNNNYSYDVFISCCTTDIAYTFSTDLYRDLMSHGLRVFLDGDESDIVDNISLERNRAIRTAFVQVAIFAPAYAKSSWHLYELLQMLESNASIIPVFYKVKPNELQRTRDKGVYARSLQRLAENWPYDSNNTIEKWRNALSRVASISGYELETCNGDKGELLYKVVQAVLRSLEKNKSKYLIGLDEKVKDFENKVFSQNHQTAKPRVVGIVGVGGVGKTTLAKELSDRKRVNYNKFCFLSSVRENARKDSLNSLQIQLLKSLTGTDVLINSFDECIEALKKHLSSCRVLVILDDVDHLNQICALLPVGTDLLSGSLVVITSRHKEVIRSSGVEDASIYQLTGLNDQHSRELLCAYAFNQPYPVPGFESLVDNFLEECDGLPIFLKVFGALLSEQTDKYKWKNLLHRLQVLSSETQEKFQISYQSLNSEEQQMFLDSACFFMGQKRDTAIRIWEGFGWEGILGFQTLQRRCLLEVDSENNIDMHDHIRDFGRAVAVTLLPLRLWHCTHISEMFERYSGMAVRGIKAVSGDYNDDAFGGIDTSTLKLLDTENSILERILRRSMHVPSLIWLRWNKCPDPSLPSWIPMESLRVLQVSGSALTTLWKYNSQAPLQLRELEINAPLSNIPKSIGRLKHLERIVVGKFLSGQVNLTELPKEFCNLLLLKAVVLTDCSKMKSLPYSIDRLRKLHHIDLSFCCNLERLPDSIVYLERLQHINLSDCHDLKRLPDSIGNLRRLQHIDLRGCHNLEMLPNSFGNVEDLRHINLSGCHDLESLPDSFGNLGYLQHIDLQGCHNLKMLPYFFGELKNLLHINLSNCHDLERLPDSFDDLRNLQYIDLSGCHNLERLPNYVSNLNKLRYLDVEGCSNLIIERIEIIGILDNLPVAHQRQLEQLCLSDA